MAEIDIVILNWNGLHFLKQYLPSVIRHTSEEEAGIVVADNGSTDGSLEWLESNYKSRIRTIALDHNYGFAGGYNRALEKINSKYTLILNSDVEVSEGWLEPLCKAIAPDNIAAVMPKIRSYNNRGFFEYAGAAGGFIDRWGVPFCRGRILDEVEEDLGQYDEVREIFWATGACMLIKTDLFKKVGAFDEFYFAHMEEIDLCWRLKANGYSLLSVPESTVFHLGGGTLPSGNHRKIFLNVRNSLLTLYKNLPRKNLWGILLVRMVLDGLAAIKFLFGGEAKSFQAVIKAHLAFYKTKNRYRDFRRTNKDIVSPYSLSGYYPRSIVVDYYLRGKRKFSRIRLQHFK